MSVTTKWERTLLHRNLPILKVTEPMLLNELMLDRQVAGMILERLSDRVTTPQA